MTDNIISSVNNENLQYSKEMMKNYPQSVDVEKIPNNERFVTNMQNRRYPELPCTGCRRVLGHFDMNLGNFLFDDDLNIVSAIDWDALSIANNPETDWRIFMRFWNQYKK